MSTNPSDAAGIRVVTVRDVEATGEATALDRYLIDSSDSGGRLAVVEHTLGPCVLAAPIHRHSLEDEYSLVIEGRLGVFQDGDEVVAEPGQLVFKPRGRWHTFWNAGDGQLRVLELIAPGGIEQLFRRLAEPGGEYDADTLPALAAEYGCEVDFEATQSLVQRHGLEF